MDKIDIKKKLEFEKKRIEKLIERHDAYIYNILKTLRNDEITENITNNEINHIINTIKKDFILEKEKIIKEEIKSNYNKEVFKIFINKEKYINKKTTKYLDIINSIENYLKRTYKINNDYSLYYCKHYLNIFTEQYKKNKIYKSLKLLLIKIYSLESKYNDITKRLYLISNNKEKYNIIKNYEQINKDYEEKQRQKFIKTTNAISQNLKILKHNTEKTCQNGFFGL